MCIISFTECLNELDRIIVDDVYVGDIVRSLGDIKEFIESYYKLEDKDNVIEIFKIINYILGNIELNYLKNNHLDHYKQLRMLILDWRWISLDINHRCVEDNDNKNEEARSCNNISGE